VQLLAVQTYCYIVSTLLNRVLKRNQRRNRDFFYLIVTGVKSIIVVTLSRKADRTAAIRQRMIIMGHTLPRDN